MLYFRLCVIVLILCCCFVADAQRKAPTVIELDNPGFEGPRAAGRLGKNTYVPSWTDCTTSRFEDESGVDLQPGHFAVTVAPKKGNTYLGMVVRDNQSWESITQQLRYPLQPNQCYTFSLHIATSPTYKSGPRGEGTAAELADAQGVELDFIHHTDPIALRIYGSTDQCSRGELLAKTDAVTNKEWKKYDFRFQPKKEAHFIMLEAFNYKPSLYGDNGHILIDELSDIVAIPCSMEPPVVNFVTPRKSITTEKMAYKVKANLKNVYNKDDIQLTLNNKRYSDFDFDMSTGVLTAELPLRKGANKIDVKGTNAEGQGQATTSIRHKQKEDVVAVVPKPKEENSVSEPVVEAPMANTLEGVKREDLKKDLKLEIKNLAFSADSTNIQEIHEKSLLKIVRFLNSNKDVTIEIGGHTNDRCDAIVCNQLSEDRALSVLQFLVRNGVDENQLRSKGYGSEQPIASNNSSYGRRRNQRVEIKILDVGS